LSNINSCINASNFPQRWIVLAICCPSVLIVSLDVSIAGLGLVIIAAGFVSTSPWALRTAERVRGLLMDQKEDSNVAAVAR
jgi:hypothetical protein